MSETEHPKGELEHTILRTSPQRTAKMMAIMLGIVIVGGVIFFSNWDYWISSPPASVAIAGAADRPSTLVESTGKEIPVTLSFIESADFRTLAFNALPGEPNNNPDIRAEVGDLLIFDVVNDGKSFHAFGVTPDEEGFAGTFPRSEIGSGSNPLKPGEGGESRFIPPEEGVYYYICTVPGHREQGMVGKIIVGDVSDMPAQTEKMMEPTTSSPVPAPGFEDVPEMIVIEEQDVESPPATMEPFTGTISAPAGSSVPGCEEKNQCFIPADVTISVGETVTWSNDDTAAHTVTSGIASEGPDGIFDSSLFMAGTTFEHTFDEAGEFDYFCMVHPWMTGKVLVN